MDGDPINPMVEFLQGLLDQVDRVGIYHSRKVYMLSDPELPIKKVAGFIKTQIDEFVRQTST